MAFLEFLVELTFCASQFLFPDIVEVKIISKFEEN
jgi:hypothetical protein